MPEGDPDQHEQRESRIGGDLNPPSKLVRPIALTVIAVATIAQLVLCILVLVQVWPSALAAATLADNDTGRIKVLWWTLLPTSDQAIFLVVAVSGATGALVHSLRSLAWYAGNRQLRYSWCLFYITLPFVGAALSTIFLLVLRGGLISGSDNASINLYGFTAIATLVGLFASEAAEKLKQVFSTLFAPAKPGRDSIDPDRD